MNKICLKSLIFLLAIMFINIVMHPVSYAESLKGKLQQRLNSSNIQLMDRSDEKSAVDEERSGYEQGDPYRADYLGKPGQPIDVARKRESAIAPAAPVMTSYAIYKTQYNAQLDENVVTVTGEIIFEVFRNGWTRLPLASSDVGLIDVSVNKGKAFVAAEGNKYYLIVDKMGKYTLNIEFLIKASREREKGPGSFHFDVMPAPISQFEFTIPESGVEIFVEPAIKVEVTKEANKTVAWAVMPNTPSITTRWTKALPKETITPVVLEPKVYVDTATCASVGEGIIHCNTALNYSIIQSEVSNFRIALPPDVSLMDVKGNELRDWKVVPEGGAQYIDVYLNYGVKGQYRLDLVYERNIGDGSVITEIPAVKATGVEREHGYIGVAASTNVELAINTLDQIASVDVKELPESIWHCTSNPILLAFKYLKQPFTASIDVTKHEELPVLIAAIDMATYNTLYTEEGKILTQAVYQIRNNVKQFLRLTLPKDSVLWSAFVGGKAAKPAKDKNGTILIPLEKSQLQGENLTQFPVEIVYLDKGSAMKAIGSTKMVLPQTDIPVSEINWSVYAPYDYTYYGYSGDMKHVRGDFRRQAAIYGVGNVRSAEDKSVSSKYFKESLSQVASQVSSYAPIEQDESEGGYRTGVLPIKIDIPQEGQLLRFSKMLVTEKETPWMSMNYNSIWNKISGPFKLIFAIVVIVFTVKMLKKYRNK